MVKEQIEKRGYVIITGGTSGIGLAAAQCLQAIGYQSILLGRDKIRGLEAVKKVIGSTYLFCDVTDTLSIKKAINEASQLGNITGVVVAAGQYKEGLIENITDEELIKILEREIYTKNRKHEFNDYKKHNEKREERIMSSIGG